jgi:hypothetical protein
MSLAIAKKRLWHPTEGRGQLLGPDGEVLWEEDWQQNALHDAGELSMLRVYLREQANPSKYLALLNDGSVAETDGTMADVTEASASGYARQQIAAGDWTEDGLQGGDHRFSATEKTFGPFTTAQAITHAALTTALTGTTGLLLLTVALSAPTTVQSGQQFRYQLRWTQQ